MKDLVKISLTMAFSGPVDSHEVLNNVADALARAVFDGPGLAPEGSEYTKGIALEHEGHGITRIWYHDHEQVSKMLEIDT